MCCCAKVQGSGFANIIEPNKNIFAVISSPGLMIADRIIDNLVYLQGMLELTSNLKLLSTHTVSGIRISNSQTTFEGKLKFSSSSPEKYLSGIEGLPVMLERGYSRGDQELLFYILGFTTHCQNPNSSVEHLNNI